MSYVLTEEDKKDYKEVFERFDKEKNGTISTNGLGKVLRALGQKPTESELESMIKEYDKSKNGFVSYKDFMDIMAKRHKQQQKLSPEELADVFSVFDLDGTGKISAQGLKQAMVLFGYDVTDEDADEMISKVDTDDDGLVDTKDFVRMMLLAQR